MVKPGAQHAVTTYAGRAGDHNDKAMHASPVVGELLAGRLGVANTVVGVPAAASPSSWDIELAAARHDLELMAVRISDIMEQGLTPVSAITRCAVALATQPAVLRHRPETVVVWLDAHGDLNVPDDTKTGYLGGMALSGPMGWWHTGLGSGLGEGNVVLAGARDLDPAEREHIDNGRIALVPPGPAMGERLGELIAGRPVYFHLDCDVLEPGLIATDYLVPNGLGLQDLRACAEAAARSDVIGIEVGEVEGPGEASIDELLDALEPLWATAAPH